MITSLGRIRMIVSVVISRETRTPEINLSLGTLFRHPTTYRGPLDAFTMTVMKMRCTQQDYNSHLSSSSCFKTSPIICPTD